MKNLLKRFLMIFLKIFDIFVPAISMNPFCIKLGSHCNVVLLATINLSSFRRNLINILYDLCIMLAIFHYDIAPCYYKRKTHCCSSSESSRYCSIIYNLYKMNINFFLYRNTQLLLIISLSTQGPKIIISNYYEKSQWKNSFIV